jgi:hypothetical protein
MVRRPRRRQAQDGHKTVAIETWLPGFAKLSAMPSVSPRLSDAGLSGARGLTMPLGNGAVVLFDFAAKPLAENNRRPMLAFCARVPQTLSFPVSQPVGWPVRLLTREDEDGAILPLGSE